MNEEVEYKLILEREGFPIIYEWEDAPNTEYPEHSHKGRVTLFIVDGSVTFSGAINTTLSKGQRFDVPPNVMHSAIVGVNGCKYIVGQEIEGDA